MSGLSTHVLDTARGLPAAGMAVTLERQGAGGAWLALSNHTTDADGRVKSLLPPGTGLASGPYRVRFETGPYLARVGGASGGAAFYPQVEVVFHVGDASRHHHIPLLLSPFGYSTYRGS